MQKRQTAAAVKIRARLGRPSCSAHTSGGKPLECDLYAQNICLEVLPSFDKVAVHCTGSFGLCARTCCAVLRAVLRAVRFASSWQLCVLSHHR